jgi:hypothetical protein
MRKYVEEKRPNYFVQGFRLGLIFGTIGALVILGRDRSPAQTLMIEEETIETTTKTSTTIAQG